jgi:magnesium transporter
LSNSSSSSRICADLNDSVAAHMRTDFARLETGQTVAQALLTLRSKPPEGRIIYFYVVDSQQHLKGVVPTRRLLLSNDQTAIEEIMVEGVICIPSSATVLDACEFFLLHRLLAFPVVDEKGRILGIVDVELYTDEIADLERREESDDLFQLIGVHLSESQQFSPLSAFKSRFPWLLTNVAGGILAAFLTGMYKAELQMAVGLALFIPVVLALAESVAIQSVSLSLQSLHGRQPSVQSLIKKLKVESATGALLGVACAIAVATVGTVWLWQPAISICLLGGIIGGVTFAALIGVAMPNALRLLNKEPQVAAGPIALALTDMVTLLIYFSIARWVLA